MDCLYQEVLVPKEILTESEGCPNLFSAVLPFWKFFYLKLIPKTQNKMCMEILIRLSIIVKATTKETVKIPT